MPHQKRHQRTAARRAASRGAALVEAALVIPVLAILVFGIIEIGLLADTAAVTSNASRNGARLASSNYATARNGAERGAVLAAVRSSVEESLNGLRDNVTPLELWVYEANAAGYPGGGSGFGACASSCIRYTWDGDRFTAAGGSWHDPQACGVELDRVGVYVRVRHQFTSRLLDVGKTVGEHTVMRIEPRTDCT